MIEVVIIGQNEYASMEKMLASLSPYGFKRIWVLDRCTDESESFLMEHNEFYVKTPADLVGRQTSYSRNLGLSFTGKDSDVLFLDGDRYITKGNLFHLDEEKTDISLLMLERDNRENIKDYSECYGQWINFFFSNGILIRRSAINTILENNNNELFSLDKQNSWGIEDTCLGDLCYHLGLTCDIYRGCRQSGGFTNNEIDRESMKKRILYKIDKLKSI